MTRKISRRTFTAGTAAVGASLAAGFRPVSSARPDIVSVTGADASANTKRAIDEMGGMSSFVTKGETVGIVINTIGRYPGGYTNKDIFTTTVELCNAAGAKEVRWIDWRDMRRLNENKLVELSKREDLVFQHIEDSEDDKWDTIQIPRGKTLKKVDIFKAIYEVDKIIMIPIIKNHRAAQFTGALKFFMGITRPRDNRGVFHPSGQLEQCIADMNTVVPKPALFIVDAMEILLTGGPTGPGKVGKPQKVIAGFDPVALDVYASPLVGIDPATSTQIQASAAHEVGEKDLSKLTVKEVTA